MSLRVARLGFISVGIETTPGVPVAQTSNVFQVSETLEGMQKSIQNTAAYAQRDKLFSTVKGERWGQGDIEWNLDPTQSQYFITAVLGSVNTTTVSGSVKSHAITQNQSSVPYTLSIYKSRQVDQQLFPYSAVDQLDIAFSVDKFASGKAGIKSQMPVSNTSGTVTASANSIYHWGNATLQFGTTVANAKNAAATPVTDFSVTYKNNTEVIFESGKTDATRLAHKDFEVSGDWTEYFENTTDRDNYYNNIAQGLVCTFLGAGSGSTQEKMELDFYSIVPDTFSVETGLDNFFIEKAKFLGAYSVSDAATAAATLVNSSSAI